MIKANELRIGNMIFIKWSKEYRKVDCLDIRDLAENKDRIQDQAEPIPLTPEILEKCGFTSKGDDNTLFEHPEPKVPEDEHKDLGTCYPSFFFNKRLNRWMDCHTRVCIDYLHQLQNLYFALTNEELKVQVSDTTMLP